MTGPILLNPGPVSLSPRVRGALTRGDWCHREPEFAELTGKINAALANVYAPGTEDYRSVLITGSGTSAVEAMLATFADDFGKTVVVSNGVYGERMARMLAAHGKPYEVVETAWTKPMDLEQVRQRLKTEPDIRFVAAVHHETTTGRLNDIGGLAAICKDFGVKLLVDAVSSFGAENICADEWNMAALAATANKCLHGVPGLSFVLASNELWAGPTTSPRSVYLNLRPYFELQHDRGYSPFTQAVQVAFALDEALAELDDDGGWQSRRAGYRNRADAVGQALRSVGIETVLPLDHYSSVLRSYWLPSDAAYADVHSRLKSDGFVIYAGQGEFDSKMFRIANMGTIAPADLERLCSSLSSVFGRKDA